MEPLTSVEDVQKRLDWELDDRGKAMAAEAIEDLSEEARYHGLIGWSNPDITPRQVCRLVGRATARFMKNADGIIQSRAGDETLVWDQLGDKAGSPFFTDAEIAMLRSFRGGGTIMTSEITAYGPRKNRPDVGLVPVAGGGKMFPYFAGEDPW